MLQTELVEAGNAQNHENGKRPCTVIQSGAMKRAAKSTARKATTAPKKKSTAAARAKAPSPSNKSLARTVDEYLRRTSEPGRTYLSKMRAAIRSAVPAEATEVISYQIPAIRHHGIVVWFAAFGGHCSLFPTAEIIERFREDLAACSTSKGTIHFPLDKPLPIALIKRMVRARLGQMESKTKR
jgi:uncharacterized protein YdhG (YjbR/CyaY superfamily)